MVRGMFIVAFGLFLSLSSQLQADDRMAGDRPDHYNAIDPKTLQDQMKKFKKHKMTVRDLASFSAPMHGISVLSASDSSDNILPASARPKGSLQLNKVVEIVDPR